jgi:transposase-like protein
LTKNQPKMDIKEQIILEYLEQGCGYRKLQNKYGISRTTICKWVQIYQGVHGLERTRKQQNHYLRDMDDPHKKRLPKANPSSQDLEKKILAHDGVRQHCNSRLPTVRAAARFHPTAKHL